MPDGIVGRDSAMLHGRKEIWRSRFVWPTEDGHWEATVGVSALQLEI